MELTEWDVEQIEQAMNGNSNAGKLVRTQSGLIGRTYYHEKPVNGKVIVHTEKGNLLCRPETLLIKGYID